MSSQVAAARMTRKKISGPRLSHPPKPLPEEKLCTLVVRGQGEAVETVLKEHGYDGSSGVATPLFILGEQARIVGSQITLTGNIWKDNYVGRQIWASAPRNLTIKVRTTETGCPMINR